MGALMARSQRMRGRCLVGASVLLLASAAHASSPARPRVVSINPCVDAILVRVADPEQIAALSHYSQDPEATSIPLALASRFKVTSGTAEEVVALEPDVVLTGPHVSPSTIFALERIGVRLMKQTVAESVEQSERQIEAIADAVGAPERGRALVYAIEQAIRAAQPADARPIGAVIWQSGGMVPGKGTLADELLVRTGYRNMSASYGLAKWDMLPLEYLIASPPELVLSVGTGEGGRDRMLGHPAVKRLAERVAFRQYSFRLLQCGGPTIIEAVTSLAAIHRELAAGPHGAMP